MKKKVLSFLILFIFIGNSLSLNANEINEKLLFKSACELYAEWMGNLFVENGLNYYEGYFGGYSDCLNKLGVSGILD